MRRTTKKFSHKIGSHPTKRRKGLLWAFHIDSLFLVNCRVGFAEKNNKTTRIPAKLAKTLQNWTFTRKISLSCSYSHWPFSLWYLLTKPFFTQCNENTFKKKKKNQQGYQLKTLKFHKMGLSQEKSDYIYLAHILIDHFLCGIFKQNFKCRNSSGKPEILCLHWFHIV